MKSSSKQKTDKIIGPILAGYCFADSNMQGGLTLGLAETM
jgi:hypothetical protein